MRENINITFFGHNDLPWIGNIYSMLYKDTTRDRERERREVLQGFSMLEKEYDCLFIDEYPGEVTIIVYSSMYPALVNYRNCIILLRFLE